MTMSATTAAIAVDTLGAVTARAGGEGARIPQTKVHIPVEEAAIPLEMRVQGRMTATGSTSRAHGKCGRTTTTHGGQDFSQSPRPREQRSGQSQRGRETGSGGDGGGGR